MFNKILVIATSALLFSLVACSDDNPSGGSVPPVTDESSSSVTGTSSDDVGGSAANISHTPLVAEDASLHVVQVILLGFLPSRDVTFALELLGSLFVECQQGRLSGEYRI